MVERVYREESCRVKSNNYASSDRQPPPATATKDEKASDIVGCVSFSEDREGYDTTRSEKALWRAVIVQALMDAASQSKKKENQVYRDEALVWLRGNSADFHTVCSNAGFNPECVRNLARLALEKGCRWRAAPGEGRRRGDGRSLSGAGRLPTNSR